MTGAGLAVGGMISGNAMHLYNTAEASSSTGSCMLDGGLKTSKSIYDAGSMSIAGSLSMTGSASITGSIGSTGIMHIYNTAEASSVAGAGVIDGGLYLAKGIYARGSATVYGSIGTTDLIHIYNSAEASSSAAGAGIIDGGLYLAKGIYVTGSATVNGSIASMGLIRTWNMDEASSSTGACMISGGLRTVKSIYDGGSMSIAGSLLVTGAASFAGSIGSTGIVHIFNTLDGGPFSNGALTVEGALKVVGSAYMASSAEIRSDLSVWGTLSAASLYVSGTGASTTFLNSVTVGGSLSVGASLYANLAHVYNSASFDGIISSWETSQASATKASAWFRGGVTVDKGLYLGGSETVASNLDVKGVTSTQFLSVTSTDIAGIDTTAEMVLIRPYGGRRALSVYEQNTTGGNNLGLWLTDDTCFFECTTNSVFTGKLEVDATETSGSLTDGAFVVLGDAALESKLHVSQGIGVGALASSSYRLYMKQNTIATGGLYLQNASTDNVTLTMGSSSANIVSNLPLSFGTNVLSANTVDATSTAASVSLEGGLLVKKSEYVTSNLTIAGTMGVNGSATVGPLQVNGSETIAGSLWLGPGYRRIHMTGGNQEGSIYGAFDYTGDGINISYSGYYEEYGSAAGWISGGYDAALMHIGYGEVWFANATAATAAPTNYLLDMRGVTVSIPQTTASSATNNGALVVAGGAGFAKSIHLGDSLFLSKSTGGTGFDYYASTSLSGYWGTMFAGSTTNAQVVYAVRVGDMVTVATKSIISVVPLSVQPYTKYSAGIPYNFYRGPNDINEMVMWWDGGSVRRGVVMFSQWDAGISYYNTGTAGNSLSGINWETTDNLQMMTWRVTFLY